MLGLSPRVRGICRVSGLCLALGCGSRSGLWGDASSDRGAPEVGIGLPGQAPGSLPPSVPSDITTLLPEEALPEEVRQELSGCVDRIESYTSVPPTVMLLIDQSGSMNGRFGQSTRWDVLRDAIVDPTEGLLTWLDASANIGLMLYTSINGDLSGLGCPIITRVNVELGNAERIRQAYLSQEPVEPGDTPTGEGIDEAVSLLNAMGGAGPRYILLLTDGQPDTCAVPDPQDGIGAAVLAVEQAFAQGIQVRTVGVSSDIARNGLQWMANAGAGKPARSLIYGRDALAEQPLYASTEPRLLAEQLKGIIGDVRTCNVELRTLVGAGRATEGSVVLDGEPLEYGTADGWSFVDDDTLLVHGAACDSILGEGERLEVHFPCVEAPPLQTEPGLR